VNVSAQGVLVGALAVSGALVFAYRVYRLTKGGPLVDAIGGGILALLCGALAVGAAAGAGWARLGALIYAVVFGVVVMPVWTLAVLIPLRPGPVDIAFTATYWSSLLVIAIAAIAL
jgi:hypothetical protein